MIDVDLIKNLFSFWGLLSGMWKLLSKACKKSKKPQVKNTGTIIKNVFGNVKNSAIINNNFNFCTNVNITNININHLTFTITEQYDVSHMEQVDYQSDDILVNIDGESLYLRINKNSAYVNLGKYFSCMFAGKVVTFWFGVEIKDNKRYAKIYITNRHIENQGLKIPEAICGFTSDNGVFNIEISAFTSDGEPEKDLEKAIEEKIELFLFNLFNLDVK